MKTFLLIIFIFFVSHLLCLGQDYNLPTKQNFNRAKISLKNFTRFEGKTLFILKDSVSFLDSKTLQTQKFSLDEINYLRVQTGSHILAGALYGGLFMGVSVLLGVIDIESDPDLVYKKNAGNIAAGFIAGGVAVGALIGVAIPKWKTYYIHNKTGYLYPVNYGFYAWKNQVGMTVNLRF